MKLLRYGAHGQEIPCMLDAAGHIRDLSAYISDFSHDNVSCQTLNKIKNLNPHNLPQLPHGARIGACLADVTNFLAIGLNYRDHAIETNSNLPPEPMIFSKSSTCINGPNDPIILPRNAQTTDWEVELAIVMGKYCYNVAENDALNCVVGYCTANDISERTFQKHRGGQFIKGKSSPSFGPLGPYLVTTDEINNPQNLALSCDINGLRQQNSNTSAMIFSCAHIIHKVSTYMRLRPGDVILTGTPAGVGAGKKPARFLRVGDTVETSVAQLGKQKAKVICS